MREKVKLFLLVWTVSLFLGLVFLVLRLTKRVEVSGYSRKKLEPGEKGLILVSNHPSLWEPMLLPLLFFPWFLFSLRLIPFSIVDKENYYDKRWFTPLRLVCLPIKRGSPREEVKSMEKMKEALAQGKILILFAEGGRTFKGEEFKSSPSGRKIRKFGKGLKRLFSNGEIIILPVWTEGGEKVVPNALSFPRFPHFVFPRIWRKTIIKIGEPFRIEGVSKQEMIEIIEGTLLELGEK